MNYKEIYLNNNYEIEDSLTFTLKEIQKYKNHNIFRNSFAIITAFNPNNELLRCIQNQDRNLNLKRDITSLNYRYSYTKGYLDDHSEDSFIIFNISFLEAIKLATKYEQYAIFYYNLQTKNIGYYKCKDSSIIIEKSL